MYYILKIEGETAKRFNTFEELTRFMVKYTFYYNFFTDSSLDELLDSRVGFDKMKYGYRNTHLRNDILEGYNLTGKDRDRKGDIKPYVIIDNAGKAVSPDILWESILKNKDAVIKRGGFFAFGNRFRGFHERFKRYGKVKSRTYPPEPETRFRNGPVPGIRKWSRRKFKYNSTSVLRGVKRYASDDGDYPEFIGETPNPGKTYEEKKYAWRGAGPSSWKKDCKCRHQWQKHKKSA